LSLSAASEEATAGFPHGTILTKAFPRSAAIESNLAVHAVLQDEPVLSVPNCTCKILANVSS
jgi:hypothetical protein